MRLISKMLLLLILIQPQMIVILGAEDYSPADSLFHQAELSLSMGDTASASALLDRALKADSKHWESRLMRGELYLAAGERRKAEWEFKQASFADSDPIKSRGLKGLGDIEASRPNRSWQAIKQYRISLNLDPGNIEACFRAAGCALAINAPEGYVAADEFLVHLICVDPMFHDAYAIWRDTVLAKNSNGMRQVCNCLGEYIQGHPGADSLWLEVAGLRYNDNDTEESIHCLERLEAAAPDYRPAERHLLRARCLLALDDTLGFEDSYWQALEAAGKDGDFLRLAIHAEAIFRPDEQDVAGKMETADQWARFFLAFWSQRDPDPLSPHNERLIEHYRRLRHAQLTWPLNDVYSKARTSESFYRMDAFKAGSVGYGSDYDPMVFFKRCPDLALQERGLLYIRHGQPNLIVKSKSIGNDLHNVEVWYYNDAIFPFAEGGSSVGDFRYIPAPIDGLGNMEDAMKKETFVDSLPRLALDCCTAVFMTPEGGGAQLEIYQSLAVDEAGQSRPPVASVAVFDNEWHELVRDSSGSFETGIGGTPHWFGVNQVTITPGMLVFASRFDIPARRVVERQEVWVKTFSRDTLDLSGIVLGSPVEPGQVSHSRHGVELLPRPSLVFTAGEIMTLYLEVYGLVKGSDGTGRFTERVTIARSSETGVLGKIRNLVTASGRERTSSLTLSFEREVYPDGETLPETFSVDTSLLLPGKYQITVEVADANNESVRRTGCGFTLEEPE